MEGTIESEDEDPVLNLVIKQSGFEQWGLM